MLFEGGEQGACARACGAQAYRSRRRCTVLQREFKPIVRKQFGKLVRPFDGGDGLAAKIFLQPNSLGFGCVLQPVEIHVNQWQSPLVFVDQHKRRAGDLVGGQAQTRRNSSHERGFACSQFSEQRQHFAAGQGSSNVMCASSTYGTGRTAA